MRYTFKLVWRLLIDIGMTHKKPRKDTGLPSAKIALLAKGSNVTIKVSAYFSQKPGVQLSNICRIFEKKAT